MKWNFNFLAHQAEKESHTLHMHQYQINSYQFPFWQLLKAFWGQKTHKEMSWQKALLWFNAELVMFSPSRWNPSPQWVWSTSQNVSGENTDLPLTGSTVLLGKLRARLWSEHFLYRIDWKYNSDRDIWLCKWVQTICQAICHLEQLHFANAGRRHRRFLLDICATVAWGLWWCCSVPPHVPPYAPVWGTRNCQGGQDFSILTWITLKCQMSICLWPVSSSEVSRDTKYGGIEHLGKKRLLQSAFQIFCVLRKGKHGMVHQRAALPIESRIESWKTVQIFS